MKTNRIILLVFMAVALGIIFFLFNKTSEYVSFKEAAASGNEVHIVGVLDKSKPMEYDPAKPNHFSFYLTDTLQETKQVIYDNPKPPDFDRSDKIVIAGKMEGEHFHADKILLKCPSKYNTGKQEITE
ncbi:MAG: cytochrome c maturation protein CcmE [Bacteroidota bacterium]|nr:cytochrome c maturation protein CcmE [Bacteroidota bacterium]